MAEIQFGEIDGVAEGDMFNDRKHLAAMGIHRPLQAGIDGNGREGSSSIVLNGGYVDDEDSGEEIIYTGHGGNSPDTKRQMQNQSWDAPGNKGLLTSEMHGLPVRITRGAGHKSEFSPSKGYKYGALYLVTEHYYDQGKDGFGICRFKLEKLLLMPAQKEYGKNELLVHESNGKTYRVPTTILRIVRDTTLSRKIKEMYNYTCQICGLRIEFGGVGYAEAAHIRPLGKPHDGLDLISNLLCLCPNHHVMLDKGHFTINDDYYCNGISEHLKVVDRHILDLENLRYHKKCHLL